ncbi:phytol kinase 1, chloroplastic isoform X2 [Hevea brasiliensis]|uniref:phytol kinase 1, chloroplastic isoform X2 n=1 Tax=Hevea brasiliensis TaxID=3981 RepID=UPI000B794CAC|nr:phytol kinase 1, chloroplastic isoform X2 [Hevea brasiliensis]
MLATMCPLSLTPALSLLLRRRHVHRSAVDLPLSSSNFSLHCFSPKPPPTLPLHFLYRAPHAPTARTSSPSFTPRAAAGGALLQDAGATAAVLAGAYCLVLAFDTLTERKLIKQKLSRKLVHILSGLLFAISWPIFRLVIYGRSLATDEGLVKSLTREGNPEELLRGPLYYVLILMLCALVFWRESPVGVISLAMMCGGDGVADIMGRRFGLIKLPYNRQKSWVGSISMFISGFLISIGMLYYYSALGYLRLNWMSTIQRVAWVALVATIVESLPTTETVDDNLSVPLISMVVTYLSFGF